jgi:hypothetical protein
METQMTNFTQKNSSNLYDKEFFTINYIDLKPFDQTCHFVKLMTDTSTTIAESENNDIIIDSLITLRRIMKYHYDLFKTIFKNMYTRFITNILYSNIPDVVFNGLTLVLDLFSQTENVDEDFDIQEWLGDLLQTVLDLYIVCPYTFIKGLAIRVLNVASINLIINELFLFIFETLGDSNKDKIERAANMFYKMMESGQKHTIYACESWPKFFRLVTQAKMRGDSEELYLFKKMLGILQSTLDSNFENFLSEYIKIDMEKLIIRQILEN